MNIKTMAVGGIATLITVGAIAGCSSDSSSPANVVTTVTESAAAAPEVTDAVESPEPVESAGTNENDAEPMSEIESAVFTVTSALDELNIEYTEPVRTEVGLSGAIAVFDMTINGYDSGINVFADEATLAEWQDLSDTFGGVHVAFDTSALSLNSSEGIAYSAEIAPQIAEVVEGEARGV